ncbi:hypothetical protein BDQ17DRAFT_1257811, partial [Cyathus striatus]
IPHLIIIDGLDECSKPIIQARIINMLASALSHSDIHIQCFIASRPELEIRNVFNYTFVSEISTQLDLDNKYDPEKDIKTYLLSGFAAIRREHIIGSWGLSEEINWPSKEVIWTLVQRSSKQFIYALTVIKYVGEA